MIDHNSRDPISLWNDLALGWLSGQEDWIDAMIGPRSYSYNNLFVCRWDYSAIEREGEDLRKKMLVKPVQVREDFERPEPSKKPVYVDTIDTSFGYFDLLHRPSKRPQVHVNARVVELPRQFLSICIECNAYFRALRLDPMTPVAFHITALYFNRITMPLLFPIFGRRSFIDYRISEALNRDLDRLGYITSKKYPNKLHRKIWRHVKKMLGERNEVY